MRWYSPNLVLHTLRYKCYTKMVFIWVSTWKVFIQSRVFPKAYFRENILFLCSVTVRLVVVNYRKNRLKLSKNRLKRSKKRLKRSKNRPKLFKNRLKFSKNRLKLSKNRLKLYLLSQFISFIRIINGSFSCRNGSSEN